MPAGGAVVNGLEIQDRVYDDSKDRSGRVAYFVVHLLLVIYALVLVNRCHGEFRLIPTLVAIVAPYVYILFYFISRYNLDYCPESYTKSLTQRLKKTIEFTGV
jgi:hypothetical protein